MDRQRVDKWLWHARVVRTRSAAAALADGGYVRINGARTDTSSRPVRPGDVVTIALDRGVRVLKVAGFAERRGSADLAHGLYEDFSPPPGAQSGPRAGSREIGTGRPTKRERRAIDRLHGRDEPNEA
ncbi:MAG: RNA-binding S4 domain-containing protein [Rhizobiales bacterium]|nr:RNA-binding S4 domain-containing protein [Hyphomicrobiales bacterium]